MNIIRLYKDFNIPFATEGSKHCRPGWVNTECPFCIGNPGLHLGYALRENYFVCWRCGWKKQEDAIAKLIGISVSDARKIIKDYGGRGTSLPEAPLLKTIKAFKRPSDVTDLKAAHRRYLESRNFDPDEIQKTWGVLGTGPMSILDRINYSRRLYIPILWNGTEVSFQTRDITNKHSLRYISCPESREITPHKTILYGHPSIFKTTECIICEGVTDVWRLGIKAVATFGIKYTSAQIRTITKIFRNVVVLFDDDPQAQIQAQKLCAELSFRGVSTENIQIQGDPGDLPINFARQLVREVL